ncbi:LytTR family DNA-binding domain-containing protein [Hydrogenophaga sp.]|uniref:LytR/AlgR family response regulator transcription factor n=1 Tax=Hydrogenophaga sp. TaxID=1904254 RepID=UPI00286E208A|nr:LytTR family DNA-binding domain-containing protein [Hydrogenophaga sp.]
MTMNATALIAEDEPLLAAALQAELAHAWPQLQIVATVGHGAAAVQQALALRPQLLFLDIRMPGQSGLEAAAELADEWPEGTPFPVIVFVTAYDQYALQAFEAQAVDYLLKPVLPERLARTVQRVQGLLAQRGNTPDSTAPDTALEHTMNQLRALLAPAAHAPGAEPLRVIQASVGSLIRLIPVDEVVVFEAADKYVRVLTRDAEVLIRTPLKDLLPQLDASVFWQVHRGTVVRADAIHSVHRDEAGKLSLRLRERPEHWPVSRLYAQRFRAM